jgi:hypothetical protein
VKTIAVGDEVGADARRLVIVPERDCQRFGVDVLQHHLTHAKNHPTPTATSVTTRSLINLCWAYTEMDCQLLPAGRSGDGDGRTSVLTSYPLLAHDFNFLRLARTAVR